MNLAKHVFTTLSRACNNDSKSTLGSAVIATVKDNREKAEKIF